MIVIDSRVIAFFIGCLIGVVIGKVIINSNMRKAS